MLVSLCISCLLILFLVCVLHLLFPPSAMLPCRVCLQKWFALLRLHETPLLHNTDSLAQGLPRGPSGRGPGRTVVGVWDAPIRPPLRPGFAGFILARPGASFY
ncbi:hypothetical protein ACQKWADRAFT_58467 [Trichoderma austrokoningii]